MPSPPLPSPDDLSRLDLRDVLRDPTRKQGFVTPMFEHIAPRYDRFTRLFSFGMDRRWKGVLIEWLTQHRPPPLSVVDVACGTGDLTFAAAKALPNADLQGIDAAARMITSAEARRPAALRRRVAFTVGDLMGLSLPDEREDAVLAGYAFRNVPRLDVALRETNRILKPGGVLLSLDFYRPPNAIWRRLFLAYLRAAGSLVGWWWHRAPVMYAYIADSIDAWVTGAEYSAALTRAGFEVTRTRAYLGGGVMLHEAIKRY